MYVEDLKNPEAWSDKHELLDQLIKQQMSSIEYGLKQMIRNVEENYIFLKACYALWGKARSPYEVSLTWWGGRGGYIRIYLKRDEKFSDYDHIVQGLIETGWNMQMQDSGVDRERRYMFNRTYTDGLNAEGALVISFGASEHCKVERIEREETVTRTVFEYKVECDDAPPPSIPEVTPEGSTDD